MKKLIIAVALLTIGLSAQARGGNNDLTLKNSMAGFTSESVEESVRLLYRTNPAIKDQITGAQVDILSEQDSTVVIGLNDGSELTLSCLRFDDWSRGGTVLKKEVVCRQ